MFQIELLRITQPLWSFTKFDLMSGFLLMLVGGGVAILAMTRVISLSACLIEFGQVLGFEGLKVPPLSTNTTSWTITFNFSCSSILTTTISQMSRQEPIGRVILQWGYPHCEGAYDIHCALTVGYLTEEFLESRDINKLISLIYVGQT